ncbi:MAG: universal stress protein [Archaeoglobus sp.]|nr:universal stress protein [Archaeoglobus sp.]MBO8181148.1 universal stress protein [Archaeoglobus sp.]
MSILVKEIRDPGKSIVKVASEIKPTLVVIGVRECSPAGKILFGSSAEH